MENIENNLFVYLSNAIKEYFNYIDWLYCISFILLSYYFFNMIKNKNVKKYKSIFVFILSIIYGIIYSYMSYEKIDKQTIKSIIFTIIFSIFFYSTFLKYILKKIPFINKNKNNNE